MLVISNDWHTQTFVHFSGLFWRPGKRLFHKSYGNHKELVTCSSIFDIHLPVTLQTSWRLRRACFPQCISHNRVLVAELPTPATKLMTYAEGAPPISSWILFKYDHMNKIKKWFTFNAHTPNPLRLPLVTVHFHMSNTYSGEKWHL